MVSRFIETNLSFLTPVPLGRMVIHSEVSASLYLLKYQCTVFLLIHFCLINRTMGLVVLSVMIKWLTLFHKQEVLGMNLRSEISYPNIKSFIVFTSF